MNDGENPWVKDGENPHLVYRAFTRIGDEKVPDAKTLARLGQAIGPEVIGELHERLMELASERGVVQGRKMRVDTTVVETNVHYPTDSSLLGDGARVLTRTMQKVEKASGGLKKRIRNRMRSVNKKVIAIALAGRLKGPEGEERRVERYRELVSLTRKIVHQAEGHNCDARCRVGPLNSQIRNFQAANFVDLTRLVISCDFLPECPFIPATDEMAQNFDFKKHRI